jgi:hypothetical protein
MRAWLAPSAVAACAYSLWRSDASIARTPRATNGHPTTAKIAAISRNTVLSGSASGITARSASTT